MKRFLSDPWACLGIGCALAVMLAVAAAQADSTAFAAFLLRWLHLAAGIVWVGLVVFVNFIQLVALAEADETARGVLMRMVVPRVAWWFRHAATASLATGAVLTVTGGYVLPAIVAAAPMRSLLLWSGAAGGIAMWIFVHFLIWPSLQIVLGHRPSDAETKTRARTRISTFARLNLILSLPVTFAMVAAAHLH
ncbi:MAG: hypothetical protein ACREC6_07400 [Hyphomicrobiaceae bacterium]